jgi:hypothetical protein
MASPPLPKQIQDWKVAIQQTPHEALVSRPELGDLNSKASEPHLAALDRVLDQLAPTLQLWISDRAAVSVKGCHG